MKFSIKDFFSKYDQIRMRIWSYLLKKSLMENFIFLCSGGYKRFTGDLRQQIKFLTAREF